MRNPRSCVRRSAGVPLPFGVSPVFTEGADENGFDVRMDFQLRRMRRGEWHHEQSEKETVWVLLHGRAAVTLAGRTTAVARHSVFEEGPITIHGGSGAEFSVRAVTTAEWAMVHTTHARRIEPRLYGHGEFRSEDRGAGLAQGACHRLVRTIFDHRTRPDSAFVVGEVVNHPGRWSTYPPHHHAQPEIYHYRFTHPRGYGHSEIGENVYKVYHGDTVKIPGGLDHSQVSAPGYGMYYLWVIRHLPRRPYQGFTFTPQHRWLLDPRRQGWKPPHAGPVVSAAT